ncbi:MAG: ABC transporter substrate-binding protein [Bacillota bacterium]
MKRTVAFVVLLILVIAFTGCGQGKTTLNVYNWGDYIDESILEGFEKEYGIDINYETFATNEDMYIKLKNGGTQYDLVFPSEYMIEKMIREEMLEKIDKARLTNFGNIGQEYLNGTYDPNNEYSVPYFWGTVGILYNKKLVSDPVDSWDILWNEKYKGQILMLDSQRDSLMVALKKLGYSMNSKDPKELEEAKQILIDQKPLVMAYVVDNGKDIMISGEAAFMVTWSGDAAALMEENEDLAYAIPKEGSNLWYDGMVIPKGSKKIDEVHKFIDYLLRADVAKTNAEYVGYSTPNKAGYELLDEETKNSEVAYPDLTKLNKMEVFQDPGSFIEEYNRVWTEVKAK